MWDVIKSKREIIKLFDKFIDTYGDRYPECTLEMILDEFYEKLGSYETYDIVQQIYTELEIWDKEDDIYYNHFKKVKENFDINSNILDLCSGRIPSFANTIAKHQLKIGNGTITCYDPRLIYNNKYSNMTLYRKEFNEQVDISNFDLITGLYTCEASETIIRQSIKNDKDFYIALCGCNHFDYSCEEGAYQEYLVDYANDLFTKYGQGKLCIDYIDEKFGMPAPILYNKRK